MTFKSLVGQITILSLSLVNFWVSHFHVSHLTHETFKLRLQNTLNMSETARVYFGVLHYWFILLKYGSHDMRHTGFRRLTVVNGTPEFWGVTAWYQSIGTRVPRA